MAEFALPIWIVLPRQAAFKSTNVARYAPALSASDGAFAFVAGKANESHIELISNRATLLALISDLHQDGTARIVLDPDEHGSGTAMSLKDLLDHV